MSKPVVTLEVGLKYKVRFNQPNPGGTGFVITEYEIQFKKADETFASTPQCNGSNQTVIDNLFFEADLNSLTDEATFNLQQGA